MSKTVGIILKLNDKTSPQLKKIAERLKITEKEAKKLHAQVTKVAKAMKEDLAKASKACAVGITAIAGATVVTLNKTREYADRIDDMSKKIGISKKSFQEWDYIIKQNGTEIDVVQRGMKTLVTQSLNVVNGNKESIKTFKKLGVNVKDSNGHLKNQEVLFSEVIEKLQKMPQGLEKSAMATKLLGKAGVELQPLLAENAKTISDLKKEMYDLGLVIDDKTIDAANTFSDNIETIQRSMGAIMMSMGNDLIPTLNDTCKTIISNMPAIRETVTPILMGVCDVIKFVVTHFKGLMVIATSVASAFITFKVITSVATAFKFLITAIKGAKTAMMGLNLIMSANPIGAVAVGVGLVVGLVTLLALNWDKVTATVSKFWNKCKEVFSNFKKFFVTHIVDIILLALGPIGLIIKGISEIYKRANNKNDSNKKIDTKKPTVNKYASGTLYAHGGKAVINEKGAELVELPEGSKVMTANATKQIMNGGSYTINLNIAGNVIGNNEFIRQVSNALGRQLVTAMSC